MARRKSRQKTRRTRRNTISLTGTAQSVIIANAMVKGATNANLYQFFTGKTPHSYLSDHYQPSGKDAIITLPELLGIDRQRQTVSHGSTGATYTLGPLSVPSTGLQLEQMKDNVMSNWGSMAVTAITVPMAFKLGKRLMTKAGVTRSANKVLSMAGLGEVRV